MKRSLQHEYGIAKKAKSDAGIFAGVKVFFASSTIRHSVGRIKTWTSQLQNAGGRVAKAPNEKGTTHIIIGQELNLPSLSRRKQQIVLSAAWLEDCLARQEKIDPAKYLIHLPELSEPDAPSSPEPATTSRSKLHRFARWLGHWKPEYDQFRDELQLVMQAKFTDGLPENQPIAKALGSLAKYEGALAADYNGRKKESLSNQTFNRRALTYAKAAATVRACAFPITKDLQEGQIPFVGEGTVRRILDIIATGTTDDIEAHRNGGELRDTAGHVRGGDMRSAVRGGAAKHEFCRLPGVGQATAEKWYELGLRDFDDLDRAVEEGGVLHTSNRLTTVQSWSLQHRHDLLAECSEADIQEMEDATLSVLHALAGPDWKMQLVGGARRGKASHDADFLVSHAAKAKAGVMRAVVEELIRQGKVLAPGQGFCNIQDGRMEKNDSTHVSKHHSIAEDRFDRLLGTFVTEAGKLRRIDLIFVPWDQWAFALLGWTGSQQYLRFLRKHVDNCGMRLNSHRLLVLRGQVKDDPGDAADKGVRNEMVKDRSEAYLVPSEGPPQNRDRQPGWPSDEWNLKRAVQTEEDLFELLGIPYRAPHERKA